MILTFPWIHAVMFVVIAGGKKYIRIVICATRNCADIVLVALTRIFAMLVDDDKVIGSYQVRLNA